MPNSNTNDRFYDALSIACGLAIFTRNQFLGACRRTPSPLCVGLATILSQMWGVDGIRHISRVDGQKETQIVVGEVSYEQIVGDHAISHERAQQIRQEIKQHNENILIYNQEEKQKLSFTERHKSDDIFHRMRDMEEEFINQTKSKIELYSIECSRGISIGNSTGFAAGYERGRRDYERDDTPMFTVIAILSAALAFSIAFIIIDKCCRPGINRCINNVRQLFNNRRSDNRAEEGHGSETAIDAPAVSMPLMAVSTEDSRREEAEIPSSRLVSADLESNIGKADNVTKRSVWDIMLLWS